SEALKNASSSYSKPILFTEFGYRSCNATAAEPWVSDTDVAVNLAAQENAYEALFRTFVPQNWFAGGFVWKWHADHKAGGNYNNDYTPQNKPALKRIAAWYAH
ncbi:MAG: glycoside hydrolase family 113, partial [Bacteroidia bacterium]